MIHIKEIFIKKLVHIVQILIYLLIENNFFSFKSIIFIIQIYNVLIKIENFFLIKCKIKI